METERIQGVSVNGVNYDELDPGIRATVRWLRANGFETIDSGDGKTKQDWIAEGAALDFPHVHMQTKRATLLDEADRLDRLLAAHHIDGLIEATYSPGSPSVISLSNVSDADLERAGLPISPAREGEP